MQAQTEMSLEGARHQQAHNPGGRPPGHLDVEGRTRLCVCRKAQGVHVLDGALVGGARLGLRRLRIRAEERV